MIDGMNASISLGIDIEKSVEATKEGIAELQRRLDAAGVKIKLKAELDKNIQQSIKNLGTTGPKQQPIQERKLVKHWETVSSISTTLKTSKHRIKLRTLPTCSRT